MTPPHQRLLKQAIRIHGQLFSVPAQQKPLALPLETWQQCQSIAKRLHNTRQRGWQHAAAQAEGELQNKLAWLRGELHALEPLLTSQTDSKRVSLRDLYADLMALHQEFTDVEICLKQQTIAVTTEPIELEDVYLGSFEIRLKWDSNDAECPFSYRIVAVDPHPAASNDSTTHPHVQSEELCEGEGRTPLRLALTQGRLLDFFTIVANLLRTYNSGSPFVSLADWEGVDCSDCGKTVSDEDRFSCEKCGSSVCDQCYYCCPDCDSIFCHECVTACSGCDEHHCHRCLQVCSACLAEVCKECLNEQKQCTTCQDQAAEEDESAAEIEAIMQSESTDPPVQSHSLGETAISS